MQRTMLVLVLLVMVTGCANRTARPELPKELSASSFNNNYVLIVGSLSRGNSLRGFTSWELYFRSLDQTYHNSVKGRMDPSSRLWGRYDFDFKERQISGNLFAYRVPAGVYEFYQTELTEYLPNVQIRSWKAEKPFSVKFLATAGSIVYIGEYAAMPVFANKGLFGLSILDSGYWAVSDKSERDLRLLKQKYPNLDWEKLKVFIPHIEGSEMFIRE